MSTTSTSRPPSILYTCGYEGITLEGFVSRLLAERVQCVVDVRHLPLSRKRGFSKKALEAVLRDAGLAYVHMRELGCPPWIRERYRADGDWRAYTRRFLPYLATRRAAVEELSARAQQATTCVICFEEDHDRCHRTYVARATGLAVRHLMAEEPSLIALPGSRLRGIQDADQQPLVGESVDGP